MHTFVRCSLAVMILMLGVAAAFSASDRAVAGDPPRDRDSSRGIKSNDDGKAVDSAKIAEGNTAFAFDLYRELSNSNDNVFVSPFSLSTALSMTFAGARTETGEEMARVLHLPHWPQPSASALSSQNRAVHEAFGTLVRDLHAPKANDKDDDEEQPGYEILLANALWGHKTETFSDDYIALIDEHYDAPLSLVDFLEPESAAEKINDWTKDNTRGLIPHLVSPSDIVGASLVLTNAIYFLGDWANEFDPDKTRDRPFHVSPSKSVTVPMMHQRSHFGHIEYDEAQAVIMPYGNGRLSMVVLLPNEGHGADVVQQYLKAEEVERWAHPSQKKVNLAMPKFKLKTSSHMVRGEPILPNLGMRRAVSAAADLTGIDGGAGTQRLYISEVIHEAVIEVDERGTEAAAATGVVVTRTAVQQPIDITVDRPFVFLIVDHETNSILFMGRMTDPSE